MSESQIVSNREQHLRGSWLITITFLLYFEIDSTDTDILTALCYLLWHILCIFLTLKYKEGDWFIAKFSLVELLLLDVSNQTVRTSMIQQCNDIPSNNVCYYEKVFLQSLGHYLWWLHCVNLLWIKVVGSWRPIEVELNCPFNKIYDGDFTTNKNIILKSVTYYP